MKVIHYETIYADAAGINLPKDAEILTALCVDNDIRIYYLKPWGAVGETRTIRKYGTGHEIVEQNLKYIGTVKQFGGSLVWHLFEQLTEI